MPNPSPRNPDDQRRWPDRELERFDRHLLTFMLWWAPFGGPPEDECFVEFGMKASRVREHCMQILRSSPAGVYSPSDHRLLVGVLQMLSPA
jgi:hypothetical protein